MRRCISLLITFSALGGAVATAPRQWESGVWGSNRAADILLGICHLLTGLTVDGFLRFPPPCVHTCVWRVGVCCVHVYYQRCFWWKYHSKEWPPKEISSLSTTFSAKAHPSKLTSYFPGCVIKVPWYYWCSSHWRPMREGTERPLCTTSAVEKVGKIWVTLWQMCFDWLSSLAHTHTLIDFTYMFWDCRKHDDSWCQCQQVNLNI